MLKKGAGLKIMLVCLAIASMAQAVTMTPIETVDQGTLYWQDINGVSYNWDDVNSNGSIDINELVTFTVDVHKMYWGGHDFDALKVWIDTDPITPTSTIYTETFIWDYNGATNPSKPWVVWTGGDQAFSFDYAFENTGTYNITASVTCSNDLSGLQGFPNDKPTPTEFDMWTQDYHETAKSWYRGFGIQGETERYQLEIVKDVPEPGSISLILLGLASLAGAFVMKRKSK